MKILDNFFLKRLHSSDSLKPTAVDMRLLASEQCGVFAAAVKIGIGERQLERRCLECTGIAPKLLSRISRFQRAIEKHRTGHGSWMKIAHEVGYYDQMHLIRDFHDLGGGAPTEVMKEIADNHLIPFACS